jgi:hypothetical protein
MVRILRRLPRVKKFRQREELRVAVTPYGWVGIGTRPKVGYFVVRIARAPVELSDETGERHEVLTKAACRDRTAHAALVTDR